MSILALSLVCLSLFGLGLLLIVAGFFLFSHSGGLAVKLHRRMAQGLAVLCMLGSAGFLEYSNYLLFTTLN